MDGQKAAGEMNMAIWIGRFEPKTTIVVETSVFKDLGNNNNLKLMIVVSTQWWTWIIFRSSDLYRRNLVPIMIIFFCTETCRGFF